MKWWDQMPWSLFSECWALSQLFHSPLLPSSRGSLVLNIFRRKTWHYLVPEFLSKVQLYKMHGRSPIWSIASSLLSFLELGESIESSHNKFALHLYRDACMHAQSLQLYLTLWNLWAVVHQPPLSMEFSRQEYCSGLLCPPPGDLPDPGIESMSPGLQADSFIVLYT